MNLHGMASGVIAAVNPMLPIQVVISEGYTIGDDGRRTPLFSPPIGASAQVQDLTGQDLRQLEKLNISGSTRKIYVSGSIEAISRLKKKGGDLIKLPDRTVWLTTQVLEQWPDWCKVSVTQQVPVI